jgi:hypothetical protein
MAIACVFNDEFSEMLANGTQLRSTMDSWQAVQQIQHWAVVWAIPAA